VYLDGGGGDDDDDDDDDEDEDSNHIYKSYIQTSGTIVD